MSIHAANIQLFADTGKKINKNLFPLFIGSEESDYFFRSFFNSELVIRNAIKTIVITLFLADR